METIRVYDLARELGVDSSRLIVELRLIGANPTSESSRIYRPDAHEMRRRFHEINLSAALSSNPRKRSLALDEESLERKVLQLLEAPNRNPTGHDADVSQVDLRALRVGLGLSIDSGAAVLGVSPGDLAELEKELRPADVREVLRRYAVHMAAWWAADDLKLGAQNLDPTPLDEHFDGRPPVAAQLSLSPDPKSPQTVRKNLDKTQSPPIRRNQRNPHRSGFSIPRNHTQHR